MTIDTSEIGVPIPDVESSNITPLKVKRKAELA